MFATVYITNHRIGYLGAISWLAPSGNQSNVSYETIMRHGLVRRRSRNISHRWMCVFRTLTCLHRTDSGPRPRHIACNIHCLFHGSLNSDTLFPCFLCKFTITFVPPLETSCREYREKHFSFSSRSTLINLILPIRNSFQGNCMVVCL